LRVALNPHSPPTRFGAVLRPAGSTLERVVRRLPLYALGAYLLVTVVSAVLGWSVYRTVGPAPSHGYLDGPDWLDAAFQGDSGWYYVIASNGYSYTPGHQSPIAFFPAFPLVVRGAGHLLGGDFSTAAGLVTLLAGAGVVLLFADWVRKRLAPRAAVVAVALLIAIYTFSQVGLQGVVSPARLQANSSSVLVYVAQALGGGAAAKVMALALALSVIASTGVSIVILARMIYGMASHRVLPSILGNVSLKYATPAVASVVATAVARPGRVRSTTAASSGVNTTYIDTTNAETVAAVCRRPKNCRAWPAK
jgi:hypothetical protein